MQHVKHASTHDTSEFEYVLNIYLVDDTPELQYSLNSDLTDGIPAALLRDRWMFVGSQWAIRSPMHVRRLQRSGMSPLPLSAGAALLSMSKQNDFSMS